MSSTPLSVLKELWYRWKSMRLPWRKRFLVGLDLQGNTFWEFRNSLFSHRNRMRRIVNFRQSAQYSEVNISPQWHQWLRYTRADPPSLAELSLDISRQEQLKIRAAAADARWASESRLIDKPGSLKDQSLIPSEFRDTKSDLVTSHKVVISKSQGKRSNVHDFTQLEKISDPSDFKKLEADSGISQFTVISDLTEPLLTEDSRKQARVRGGPSEEWQPKTWDGSLAESSRKSNELYIKSNNPSKTTS